ncbi:hypothetical protein [Butyrivibrio proteoclasticus]|uniref:hypothetical protein n=1 Tax=Butyrivibrio proteoclasticus TaxID=43305 RepID=UPI00047D68D5|nr:hypothetical protein [Butyrivibrio proteoclasticus]
MTRETWVQIPENSKFVNVGVDFNGEIDFFKIIIIDDLHIFGFVVINPDGDQSIETTVEDGEVVEAGFSYDNRDFSIQLLASHKAYELIFSEV